MPQVNKRILQEIVASELNTSKKLNSTEGLSQENSQNKTEAGNANQQISIITPLVNKESTATPYVAHKLGARSNNDVSPNSSANTNEFDIIAHKARLIEAVKKRDQSTIKEYFIRVKNNNLILKSQYRDTRDKDGTPLLILAVLSNTLHRTLSGDYNGQGFILVKQIAQSGVNLNEEDNNGNTALMIASLNFYTQVVKVLTEAKADITLTNNEGKTALDLAKSSLTEKQYKHMFKLLGGTSIESEDSSTNPNDDANINESLSIPQERLIEAVNTHELRGEEAIDNACDINDYTPLMRSIKNYGSHKSAGKIDGNGIREVERLVKLGVNPNAQNKNNDTALMFAAQKGLYNAVAILIKAGADITLTNNEGKTALDVAAKRYSTKTQFKHMLKLLGSTSIESEDEEEITKTRESDTSIESEDSSTNPNDDANINEHLSIRQARLIEAVNTRNYEIINLYLVKRNGSYFLDKEFQNIRSSNGDTLIIGAIKSYQLHTTRADGGNDGKRFRLVEKLIEAGLDVNAYNNKGETALMIAVKKCLIPMVRILIEAEADISIPNNNTTVLDLIKSNSTKSNTIKELLQKNISKSDTNSMDLATDMSTGKTKLIKNKKS